MELRIGVLDASSYSCASPQELRESIVGRMSLYPTEITANYLEPRPARKRERRMSKS
jgi:hypothetical protein